MGQVQGAGADSWPQVRLGLSIGVQKDHAAEPCARSTNPSTGKWSPIAFTAHAQLTPSYFLSCLASACVTPVLEGQVPPCLSEGPEEGEDRE